MLFRSNAPNLVASIKKMIEEDADLKKQMEEFAKEKQAQIKDVLLKNAETINGITVIKFVGDLPADAIKNIAFQVRGQITEKLFFVAGTQESGKPLLTVAISDDMVTSGYNASQLVREGAKLIQGGGGGQSHFAQAGGKNADGLHVAVDKILESIKD